MKPFSLFSQVALMLLTNPDNAWLIKLNSVVFNEWIFAIHHARKKGAPPCVPRCLRTDLFFISLILQPYPTQLHLYK